MDSALGVLFYRKFYYIHNLKSRIQNGNSKKSF